jgi:hypothetical protein
MQDRIEQLIQSDDPQSALELAHLLRHSAGRSFELAASYESERLEIKAIEDQQELMLELVQDGGPEGVERVLGIVRDLLAKLTR